MTEEGRATYEIWDRFSGNLVLDFADRATALEFVCRQTEGLDHATAARAVERLSLERVVNGTRAVLAQGAKLLELLHMSAEQWQLAQAWADAQAIADGDIASGSWDDINAAAERARRAADREQKP